VTHPFDRRKKTPAWKTQEQRLAKKLKGRVTPGSGSTPVLKFKGDVVNELYVVEAKSTKDKSYSLKLEDLRKVVRYAFQQNKLPAFQIQFEDGKAGNILDIKEWVLIPLKHFEELQK